MKTLLTILCILLLFFCLLNLLRLRISLEYDEGGAHVTLFLGRVPILKLPGEKKTSAEKKGRKKKRKRKKEAPEGKSKGGSVPGFHALLKIIADVLGKLKRRLIVEELPQFYFRTTDVTGVITLPDGVEMCMPGDNVDMHVELITPIAIEKELRFAIREGGRTVGSGVVIAVEE